MIAAAGFGQEKKPAKAATKAGQPDKTSIRPKASKTEKKSPAARDNKAEPKDLSETVGAQPSPTPEADKAKYQQALAGQTISEKARLLRAFLDEFPLSEVHDEAVEYLVTARAIVGGEQLQAGDPAGAAASYKLAVDEAPAVIPDRLFNDVILKFPANLFYKGDRTSAYELAGRIEKKVAANTKQLLGLVGFYLSIENGSDARRLAETVVSLDPNSAAGYQAMGLANRLNFDLEESAAAYAKALELDPASVPAQRSLAEMKRALGKPDEAAAIYRSILALNENDFVARGGLALSLFDGGKRTDAEAELTKALAADPKNFGLLAGAAYWYAANDLGQKAVEYGQKAVDAEPRYVWGHISLARGLMKQNKPVEAERALIAARQYGSFPTLAYEIASARFQAGFFREAVEDLAKSFTLENGTLKVRLGGRVLKEAANFHDLVAFERKASILQPSAADNADTAARLRILLELKAKAEEGGNDVELAALTDEFVKGDDKMKLHRQLYAADLLLRKNAALPKVAELIKASVGNTEAGLDVSSPAAATMASELYESRTIAFSRNEVILVPDVPRQMLSAILRGRIEELAGWTLYQQKNYPDSVVRLRRAISVLPEKSAWWRSSLWRLGAALEADGKDQEALDSYIQSYKADRPNSLSYGVIEALYRRINGNVDGLDEKIGPNPGSPIAALKPQKPESSDPAGSLSKESPLSPSPQDRTEPPPAVPAKIDSTASQPPAPETTVEIKKVESKLISEPLPVVADNPADTSDGNTASDKTAGTVPANPPEIKKQTETPDEPSALKPPPITADVRKEQPDVIDKKSEKYASADVPEKATESRKPESETAGASAQNAVQAKEPLKTIDKTDAGPLDARPRPIDLEKVVRDQKPDPVSESLQPAALDPSNLKATDPDTLSTPSNEAAEPKNAADTSSTAAKPESPSRKPLLIVEDPLKTDEKASKTKDLFEPVVITVPRQASSQKTGELSPIEPKPDTVAGGSTRRRLVEGKEIISDQKCTIEVNQDTISLLSGGGSMSVLVAVSGEADAMEIKASSTSSRDIEIRSEPDVAGRAGRRFFVIKSIGYDAGVYQVNFESPCGKKVVTVHVR